MTESGYIARFLTTRAAWICFTTRCRGSALHARCVKPTTCRSSCSLALESSPAVSGRRQGYTLDKASVYCRAMWRLALTPTHSFELPNSGRRPDYLERTRTDTGRTRRLHRGGAWPRSWRDDSTKTSDTCVDGE